MKQIELTKEYVTLVDDEDFEYLNQFKWHADVGKYSVYAKRTIIKDGKKIGERMQNIITKSKMTDHIDRNGLNNQKYNLRPCNHSQNGVNRKPFTNKSSIFKGIYWLKKNKKWRVRIRFNNNLLDLGCFIDEIEAAKTYDRKALELFGEFAYLNFS